MTSPRTETDEIVRGLEARADRIKSPFGLHYYSPGDAEFDRLVATRLQSLEAENKRMREALEWQPIETAPKDGTRILLGGTFYSGAWEAMTGATMGPDIDSDDRRTGDWIVTHWLPLPPAPEGEG